MNVTEKILALRDEAKGQRFWAKVSKPSPEECWAWTASRNAEGYGHFFFSVDGNKRLVHAHRVSYQIANGPIPAGREIDHLCKNRWCVNPIHLEAVTRQENIRRSNSISNRNAAVTSCPHGHPYAGDNIYHRRDGSRECRTCLSARNSRYYHARRAKQNEATP